MMRSVLSAAAALRRGECSSVELTKAFLARIQDRDGAAGAYLTVDEEGALRAAEQADARLRAGDAPLLCGIPYAAKDNLTTAGLRTTCASRMLEHFIPPEDAHAVALLREQGAVLLGKANMDEFGMGSETRNSALGVTCNPLDPARVPGGSSGGSAAAVAGEEALFSLGTDTGGSIRQPAAFCGLVGLRPTYGAVSRRGMISFSSGLDQIGPICRTVADCACVFEAIARPDAGDSTCAPGPRPDLRPQMARSAMDLTVAVPGDLSPFALSPAARDAFVRGTEALRDAGVRVEPMALPASEAALAAYYVISSCEASSNLARYDGIRYGLRIPAADTDALYTASRSAGFGPEVRRRILFGTYLLSADCDPTCRARANAVRRELTARYGQITGRHTAILMPTTPDVAPLAGTPRDARKVYAADLLNVPAALAGLPALTVPFGTGEAGMPLGLSLVGPRFGEGGLFALGTLIEEAGQ